MLFFYIHWTFPTVWNRNITVCDWRWLRKYWRSFFSRKDRYDDYLAFVGHCTPPPDPWALMESKLPLDTLVEGIRVLGANPILLPSRFLHQRKLTYTPSVHMSISCYQCKSWVSRSVPSCWYLTPDYWFFLNCHQSQHPSYSLPQEHACTNQCSSHSFSRHRLPHSVELPLSYCVSHASHQPDNTSWVSVPQTRWCDVRCVRPWKRVQAASCWSWGMMRAKGTCSCPLPVCSSSWVVYRSSSCYRVLRNRMIGTSHTSCELYSPCHSVARWVNLCLVSIVPRYRMCFWIHCIELVYDVFGHVQNDKSDEEWFHHLAHRCIQLDTNEILWIHGCSCNHIISMLLDDGLAFIPNDCQTSLSSVSGRSPQTCHRSSCQQLVQVLFHSGLGLCSFLTQHIHIFEYEWSLFELNDVMNVSDTISLLYVQLKEWVMD